MKKFKLVALVVMLAFLVTVPGFVHADETVITPNKLIVFKIDDLNYYTQEIGTDKVDKKGMDTAPIIKDDRTFVPVRFLGNALGVDDNNITWNDNTKTATLKGLNELKLAIGSKTMQKDNQPSVMDVAPIIINDRTMLPARYVAEGLGFKVDWDEKNRLVMVYPEGTEKPDINAILTKIKGEQPAIETKIVDLGMSTDPAKKDFIEVANYNIRVGNNGVSDPGIWFGMSDAGENKDIKVVCTSHPEWNKSIYPMIDGKTKKEFPNDVWGHSFALFKEGYTPEPKSGDRVTFDVYGKVNGQEVKLATITKTLP